MSLAIRENVPLRDLTTFRIGGPARFFCEVSFGSEIAEAIEWARKNCGGTFFILGGGSNILVADEGFDGLVIFMKMKGMEFGETIKAGAGENWDAFVGESVSRGFFGAENLSGIPGTVGAAPVQNIGAYGAEVSSIIESVQVYDTHENTLKVMKNAECKFEYRDSIFKHEKNENGEARYIITSVTFNLKKFISAEKTALNLSYRDLQAANLNLKLKTPAEVRATVLSIRAKKLPDVAVIGTAGSFFKNPIITGDLYESLKKKYPDMPSFPAGGPNGSNSGMVKVKVPLAWILDHVCGYKGVTKGAVGTYQNQALVIVNNGAATAADIKNFADEIAAAVKEKTAIEIEPEVQYVS